MKRIFTPIPDIYRHLTLAFQQETFKTSRSIIRVGGWCYGLSLVIFVFLVPEPYFRYPEIILLDIINAFVCIFWMFFSNRTTSPMRLHRVILFGTIVILLSNMGESMILGDFMSMFLIALTGTFLGIMMPWPTTYTALISMTNIVTSLSMLTYWKPFLIGPLVTANLFSITSIFIQLFLNHQRWENFQSRHHIGQLNTELHAVNEQLREHSNRLESEMALARHVQQGLLPSPTPSWPGFDVVCYSQPALEIGGDFYSYHMFEQGHVALAVGDVSGKGVAAALLMATGMSLLASTLTQYLTPANRMALLDRTFMTYTNSRRQNCALCYVEYQNGILCMVNAGCIPPYIRRCNGSGESVEIIDVHGIALGHGWGARDGYQEVCVALPPGDLVILTSDGIVEAMNSETGELFGFERLHDTIAIAPTGSAQAMLSFLLTAINNFVGNHTHSNDDLTVMVFQVEQAEQAEHEP